MIETTPSRTLSAATIGAYEPQFIDLTATQRDRCRRDPGAPDCCLTPLAQLRLVQLRRAGRAHTIGEDKPYHYCSDHLRGRLAPGSMAFRLRWSMFRRLK
jgi:hypothetical protein